ncbi:hypothetical protein [Kitasatospora humi]|uniref:hypothetical protein n=1 Tax=Kitasatospora humi TaxID=2893891 RepID=UPI0035580449
MAAPKKSLSGRPALPRLLLALGIVVRAVVDNSLATALGHVIPGGASLAALLGLARAGRRPRERDQQPAQSTLVLLPLATPTGPAAVLAVLLGVNIGPNLTYAGSLATLLWWRIVHEHEHEVDLAEFARLGLLAVPTALGADPAGVHGKNAFGRILFSGPPPQGSYAPLSHLFVSRSFL